MGRGVGEHHEAVEAPGEYQPCMKTEADGTWSIDTSGRSIESFDLGRSIHVLARLRAEGLHGS